MTTSKKPPLVSVPHNVLRELLTRPGGKSRINAIADAESEVETLRATSLEAIEAAIESIEAAARGQMTGRLSRAELECVLKEADLIVALADTFGLTHLDAAGRSLCDLTSSFLTTGQHDADPVRVHARALRLFSPKNKPLSDEEAQMVLTELVRFCAHFGARPLHADADME
jgi:hypothetical protein